MRFDRLETWFDGAAVAGPREIRSTGVAWLPYAITLVYGILIAAALTQHEMWRDEIEAWLYTRDSGSVADLLRNLQNEGHPPLWYLLLLPITRLSSTPEAMKVLHLLLAVTTVYLVAKHAPFTRLQVLVFPLGFYMGWQYAVVSRNYALSVLLLVGFCVLYPRRYDYFPLVGLLLFLAAHTHLLALILVMAFGLGLAMDAWDQESETLRRPTVWAGFGLIVLGIVTAILQVVPDRHYAGPGDATARFLRDHAWAAGAAVVICLGALFYVLGRWRERMGNLLAWVLGAMGVILYTESSVLGAILGAPGIKAMAFFGLIAYVLLIHELRDRLPLLLGYGLGITGLTVFFTALYSGGPHHYGMLFIALVMGYWLERTSRPPASGPASVQRFRKLDVMFTLVLLMQGAFGIRALYDDFTRPYSQGRTVARYIESQGWREVPLAGCLDFSAQTVAGYLGNKKIYYPQGARWGTFIVWDGQRLPDIGLDECLQSAAALGKDVLVVSSHMGQEPSPGLPFDKIAEFRGAIREDEDFVLYRSKPASPARER